MAINVKAAALGEFAEMGYSLKQDDGDVTVSLWFKDGFITRFNQTKATIENIRAVCREHWNGLMQMEAY